MPKPRWSGLPAKKPASRRTGAGVAEREAEVAARVSAAETALAAIEKTFSELTGALADLVARRNQLERAVSEHSVRLMRLEAQIGEVENELADLDKPENGAPDVVALAAAAEAAQDAVAQAEAAALRAEAAHSGARQALDVARGPQGEADRRVNRLEAEAKALAKLIDVEAKKLWPPAIDLLTVDKGYEAALGAALGDDLEAPVDPASPIRWAGATADGDPALPEGAEPLAQPRQGASRACAPAGADRRGRSRARRDARRRSSSPASGWYRPRATCGAGTALRPPRMRRPRRRAGSPRRTASPISTRELGPRAHRCGGQAPRRSRLRKPN